MRRILLLLAVLLLTVGAVSAESFTLYELELVSNVAHEGGVASASKAFTPVDCTGLTKENGYLMIDLKVSNPSYATTNGNIEITSSGAPDVEEWSIGSPVQTLGITDTYQTFIIPLSSFGGDSDDSLVVSEIDYIRFFNYASGGDLTVYWKNAHIVKQVGNGTESDPYIITDVYELEAVNGDLSAYYELSSDIDASVTSSWCGGAGFTPIGDSSDAFTGTFDGKGYEISNLYINRPSEDDNGLFGYVRYATIENFLLNADVTGALYSGAAIGRVGYSTVSNIGVTGDVYGTYHVGGFIGIASYETSISNCWSAVNVDASTGSNTGGFIGNPYKTTTLVNCFSYGSVTNGNGFSGPCGSTGNTATSCYWDTVTSGQTSSSLGTGKTTAEMGELSTFSSWDFANIWIMGETYPELRIFVDEIYIMVSIVDENDDSTIIEPDTISIYTDSTSYPSTYNSTSKVTTFTVSPDISQYVLSGDATNYYSRAQIINWEKIHNDVNLYLISENETVIYDQFKLTDVSVSEYAYDEYIIRLDKPASDGSKTVFSSYFDYNGIAATRLVATDQYILYVITPEKTINYGWLTPDADGQVTIILNDFEYEAVEEWLDYTYECTDSAVTFDYTASKAVDTASFIITSNGAEIYNVNAATDTGSFTYNFAENATYMIDISVTSGEDKFSMQKFIEIGKSDKHGFFPDSYSLLLKSICVMFGIVLGVIGLSSYRTDLSAMWAFGLYAFAVYQEWIFGNRITVAIIGIIALAAIKKFQKRESRM